MADSPRQPETVIQSADSRNQQFFNVRQRPEVQQVQQLAEPNVVDMARNFLVSTVPAIVVGVINTVREIVGVVQSSLAAQQQQQNQGTNQLTQNPANETRPPQAPAPTLVRPSENNTIQTVQSASQAPVNPQVSNELQFGRGSGVGNTKMPTSPEAGPDQNMPVANNQQTPRMDVNPKQDVVPKQNTPVANNPQTPIPDANQKKDLDAAIWLTGRFGAENGKGQRILQIGDHTCIYDPKNKNFEIKDSSQKTMLTFKDGKVQGTIPAGLTSNIQQQQTAAITAIQRDSRQPQQEQAQARGLAR